MAKTLQSIVEELLSDFRGFTAASDQVTSLTADISDTDTTFVVADASTLSAGVIEIGDELIWVKSFDQSSGTITVLPRGRGWAGTTAAAHSADDTVVVSPAFPRSRVKNAVLDAIQALYPTIFPVSTNEFVYNDGIHVAWGIPTEAEQILDVSYRDVIGNWQRVRAWEVERKVNTTDFPTGTALRITQMVPYGQTVRVTYGTRPAALVNESDLFTATGYDEQVADLIPIAVKARLLPMLDVSRLQITYAAADQLDQQNPLGSAVTIGEKFGSLYKTRLAEQVAIQNRRYPARIHITR